MNLLIKLWLKLTNKNKYLDFKYKSTQEKKLIYYNKHIKNEIDKIGETLKTKKELNFMHSGHLGDLIYSLALVQHLSKNHKCNFYINSNKKLDVHYSSSKILLINTLIWLK